LQDFDNAVGEFDDYFCILEIVETLAYLILKILRV